jgi:hypothetical protein
MGFVLSNGSVEKGVKQLLIKNHTSVFPDVSVDLDQ